MFEHIPAETLRRAMQPPVTYGRRILGETLRREQAARGASTYLILTQPEPWAAAGAQFADRAEIAERVVYLRSMEHEELGALERSLPSTEIVLGIGGGQAMDAAKFVAWQRDIPLILAPTIVSVDAAVTNTIAIREGQRVRYIGFLVADAIPVDLEIISQAPTALNRAGIGDLLSIHTALWDWKHAEGSDYNAEVAAQASAILDELDRRAESIAACTDEAFRFIMESYMRENALCLQVGSSRPEEGSEHYLGYNLEYITGRGYVHGQLICLCTYAMARLQEQRPEWVRTLIERAGCPWRLSELGISHEAFSEALLTLRDYAQAENFPASVITMRPLTADFAALLARECDS